jgi:hypothetical protein
MGADKNSSPKRNSAYAPNSQPRIPTRVCQGSVVTSDLPTLGANPKQSQSESETQRTKDLAAQHWTRRTVRKHRMDRPRGLGGLSADTGRTVRKAWADFPRGCDGSSENNPQTSSTTPLITVRLRWARGPSAPLRTVRHSSTDRPRTPCNKNPPAKWIEQKSRKNTQRTRRTGG